MKQLLNKVQKQLDEGTFDPHDIKWLHAYASWDGWIKADLIMPEIGRAVWLKDEKEIWIGARDMVDDKHWLYGNSYNCFWHDGDRWVCDNEIDDDYQPTHWKPLPQYE